jgi:putative FmdB family regulatory protein
MPIYEYRCTSCGVRREHLQKISDPRLTTCPECGKETYEKQVTAAGFQLKGSGWYVTDFRNGSSPGKSTEAKDSGSKDAGPKDAAAGGDAAAKDSGAKDSGAKDSAAKESKDTGSSAATPAPAPSTPTSTGT